MGKGIVSTVVIDPADQAGGHIGMFLDSLAHWQGPALDRVQVIVVCQGNPQSAREASARQPYAVEVVQAEHESVGGYPLWDVLAELRQVEPMLAGRWLTVLHAEFLLAPGRLNSTCDALEAEQPLLALGNLLRPWGDGRAGWGNGSCDRLISESVTDPIHQGRWDEAADALAAAPVRHWCHWNASGQPAGYARQWQEDIFFARRDWLAAWDWTSHGGEMPLAFQDVYDLVGVACQAMAKRGLAPPILRLDRGVSSALHLWHPRVYGWATAGMRDWFLGQPQRWAGTTFLRADLWRRLLAMAADPAGCRDRPVHDLRRGPGGTVTRFHAGLSGWLRQHGDALRPFIEPGKECLPNSTRRMLGMGDGA